MFWLMFSMFAAGVTFGLVIAFFVFKDRIMKDIVLK